MLTKKTVAQFILDLVADGVSVQTASIAASEAYGIPASVCEMWYYDAMYSKG